MSGHTPGPWTIAPRTGRYQAIPAIEDERHKLASINALEFEAISVGTPNGQMAMIPLDESSLANANLIAAAPCLLEALESCLVQLDGEHMPSDESLAAIELARKAIARAKGEA